jgi:hypothetical protein
MPRAARRWGRPLEVLQYKTRHRIFYSEQVCGQPPARGGGGERGGVLTCAQQQHAVRVRLSLRLTRPATPKPLTSHAAHAHAYAHAQTNPDQHSNEPPRLLVAEAEVPKVREAGGGGMRARAAGCVDAPVSM